MISYASYNLLHTHTHTHNIASIASALRLGSRPPYYFYFFYFFSSIASALRLGSRPPSYFYFFYFFCLQCKRPPSWVAPRSQKGSSQAALSEHGDRERGWQPWTSRPAAFSHSRFPDGAPCLGASTCGSGPSNTLGTR